MYGKDKISFVINTMSSGQTRSIDPTRESAVRAPLCLLISRKRLGDSLPSDAIKRRVLWKEEREEGRSASERTRMSG